MKKATGSRRQKVCLISTHPLVLKEFERFLGRSDFQPQICRIESPLLHNLSRLPIPQAATYVIDEQGFLPGADVLVRGHSETFALSPDAGSRARLKGK